MAGTMVERSPGRWWLKVPAGRDPATGRTKYLTKTVDAKGKKEARIELAKFVTEVSEGNTTKAPKRLTLAAYLDKWLKAHAVVVSTRTLEEYERIINLRVKGRIGQATLSSISGLDLQQLYADLLKSGGKDGRPLSERSVHHVHRCLFTAFEAAVRTNHLRVNPARTIKGPRVEGTEMSILNGPDEISRFLAKAAGHKFEALIILALATGLRRGEIIVLRWSDVDLERGTVSVNRAATLTKMEGVIIKAPKTKKGRRKIALPSMAVETLKAHKKRQAEEMLASGARSADGLVFCDHTTGEMLKLDAVTKAVQDLAKKAKVNVTLHGLRHSHASMLLAGGVHPKVAQERLGHSTVNVTLDIYSHLMEGMQETAAAAMDAPLRTAMEKAKKGTGDGG